MFVFYKINLFLEILPKYFNLQLKIKRNDMKSKIIFLISILLSGCSSINSFYEDRTDYSAGTTLSLYWNQEQCYKNKTPIYLSEHEDRIPRYPNTYFKNSVGGNKQFDEFMHKNCPYGFFTEKTVAGIPEYFLNILMLPVKILDQTGAVLLGHSSFDTREKTQYYLPGFFALPFAILFDPFTTLRGRPNYEFLEEK